MVLMQEPDTGEFRHTAKELNKIIKITRTTIRMLEGEYDSPNDAYRLPIEEKIKIWQTANDFVTKFKEWRKELV
jgi:DNA-binding XRE family transcriptional regulator